MKLEMIRKLNERERTVLRLTLSEGRPGGEGRNRHASDAVRV